MYYNKFEDTKVWKDARKFVSEIYRLIKENKELKRDFSLADQLKWASCSVMRNISEGFERGSMKEFAHFLSMAKGSAGEVRTVLFILLNNGYINQEYFDHKYSEIKNISIQLASFRKFLIKNNQVS